MSYKIGPKELFVPNNHERNEIIQQDNESSVTWYKNNYLDAPQTRQHLINSYFETTDQAGRVDKCVNGDYSGKNFLLFCARHKNVTLVKFIVNHIDAQSTLNLLGPTFYQTALADAVMIDLNKTSTLNSEYQTRCEKSYACTKILLEGGASPNTFFSYAKLIEDPFSEQSLIPSVAASVLINWTAMVDETKKDHNDENYKKNCFTYARHLESMFLLFFQHGASITLCDQYAMDLTPKKARFKITGRQINAQSEAEESDTPYLKKILPKCVELIKYTQVKASWEKHRLIFLAAKSQSSPFANNPPEVTTLISHFLATYQHLNTKPLQPSQQALF